MKIMFLYPNHKGFFRCPVGLTVIMTVIANAGHKVELFDTTFISAKENIDDKIREEGGFVPKTASTHLFNPLSQKEIESSWIKAIEKFKPDIIGTTIVEDFYEYCDNLLGVAKKKFNIPVVAGGSVPTVVPQVIIENPNIDYVIEGEGEIAFKELLSALEKGNPLNRVPNLWYKDNGKVINTRIIKYLNLDEIPKMRLDFWDDKHFLKPYKGKMYKTGVFEASRGCMHKCHYCINRAMQVFQGVDAGKFRRNKSVDKIINEISEHHKERRFELIMFTDDNFLARQPSELDIFFKRWSKEVKIPYWINTCIETVNEHNLPKLKESGCIGIAIGVETGSDWVRQNLLLKGKMKNDFYIERFALMVKYKIRSSANNMIGIPGEYEEDFFETIKLNKAIRELDKDLVSSDVSFMAPYMGTVMHNIALEMDLIDIYDKLGFKGMCSNSTTARKEPVMHNPCMSKEKILELFYDFENYITGKKAIPEKFLKNDPSRRYADNDEIYNLYEKYKQGPIDPVLIKPKNSIQRRSNQNAEQEKIHINK